VNRTKFGARVTALAAAWLAACAVGPNYRAPEVPPAALINAQSAAFTPRDPEAAWWQEFADPELNRLVRRALGANLDLQVAATRVQAARALFTQSQYDFAPHVPLTAGFSKGAAQQPGFGTARVPVESDTVGFDAQWELDLFGHVRRSVEAARADLGEQQADFRGAEVSVAAEVARNYFALRGTQTRLDVARRNLESQAQTESLTRVRYDDGRVSELDVERARARLKATEATVPPLEAQEQQSMYRLAVLLGERPGSLDAELAPLEIHPYARALPIGDTAALLRRRPDVQAAERRLAAASARVGVATADLFPRVSVSGFVGFISGDVGQLFSTSGGNDARAWSVTPTVSWAAFDIGSVRARLRVRQAELNAATATYAQTVLLALEETENSFTGYAKEQAALKSLSEQARASAHATELADLQYRAGVADFLTLLDAQRTQLEAEDEMVQAQTEVNLRVVAIYKALGGVGQPQTVGAGSRTDVQVLADCCKPMASNEAQHASPDSVGYASNSAAD
jgi:multidrug efflux system outer membrane protein